MFSLSLKVDYLKLEREILLELKSMIDTKLVQVLPRIYRDCVGIFDSIFENNPTYLSLLNGVLRTDFGLVDPTATLQAISAYIKANIFWRKNSTSVRSTMLTAGFTIGIATIDLAQLIPLQSSAGSPVPWLDWLLNRGSEIVISDYNVTYNHNKNSRTGQALMIRDNAGYSVPHEFAGTASDNFITQTFALLTIEFDAIIQRHLKGLI